MATGPLTEKLAATHLVDADEELTREQSEGTISLRALLSTRDAGIIIGKGGKNVADLREQTGVRAGVSKAVPGVLDRILNVSGSVDSIAKAYTLIATNLAEGAIPDEANVSIPALATSQVLTIRLLVAHGIMGSIIGKQGAKIKHIQETSEARMVASKDMLPQSTERVVEVTGTPVAIGTAIKLIAGCFQEDQTRLAGTIFYQTDVIAQEGTSGHIGGYGGVSVLDTSMPGFQNSSLSARGRRQPSFGNSTSTPRGSYQNARAPDRRSYSGVQNNAQFSQTNPLGNSVSKSPEDRSSRLIAGREPDDPELRTQNISFPADMIGCIIGRGGSKISEIRKLSGSRINISKEANPETGERLFSIIGTTETNEKALFLLYSSLEAEKERRGKDESAQINADSVTQ